MHTLKQKEADIARLLSGRVNFKERSTAKDKEGCFITITEPIH